MKTWTTQLVTINEVAFDGELHVLEVRKLGGVPQGSIFPGTVTEMRQHSDELAGELLGTIYPGSIADMQQLIVDLDGGSCPIADKWEDGNGNDCVIEGWGR